MDNSDSVTVTRTRRRGCGGVVPRRAPGCPLGEAMASCAQRRPPSSASRGGFERRDLGQREAVARDNPEARETPASRAPIRPENLQASAAHLGQHADRPFLVESPLRHTTRPLPRARTSLHAAAPPPRAPCRPVTRMAVCRPGKCRAARTWRARASEHGPGGPARGRRLGERGPASRCPQPATAPIRLGPRTCSSWLRRG